MKARRVSNINCRLPTPNGKASADCKRACALYWRLYGPNPLRSRNLRRRDTWELTGLLSEMDRRDLANYYDYVGEVVRAKG